MVGPASEIPNFGFWFRQVFLGGGRGENCVVLKTDRIKCQHYFINLLRHVKRCGYNCPCLLREGVGEVEVQLHSFLNSALDDGWVVNVTYRMPRAWEITSGTHFEQKTGWASGVVLNDSEMTEPLAKCNMTQRYLIPNV
jgi:hypothetical protein